MFHNYMQTKRNLIINVTKRLHTSVLAGMTARSNLLCLNYFAGFTRSNANVLAMHLLFAFTIAFIESVI
ncbi:MAG: hypothetical protein B6D34_14030 [Candidatus Brocadia sp. UTAMX1]|nr:MAG: hypothetical protein B6D34_14030 [Candidatus Brocadia sp. UTAMX1]